MHLRLILAISFAVGLLASSPQLFGQSRTLGIGDVSLQLGMSQAAVMKGLAKYRVRDVGSGSYIVDSYDAVSRKSTSFGVIGFDNGQLTYISRNLDTSGWPNDEGYSVARAIADAVNSSIPVTDPDGSKRATLSVTSSNTDAVAGAIPINMRTLAFYINDRLIRIALSDSRESRGVTVSITIRTKPW